VRRRNSEALENMKTSDQKTELADGVAALIAVRPTWTRLERAGDVIGLPGRWLLHAGPPFSDPRKPVAPVLSSAVLACQYERWAKSADEAERLIASGEVQLVPAQSQRCVTPLAALVSPGTTLIVVEDDAGSVAPAYAPLGTTGGPDLRFGTRDSRILDRLALRDGEQRETLRAALDRPIDLLAIAVEALARADDLHNRTTAATSALGTRIAAALAGAQGELRFGRDRLIEALAATPLFFLTFWMAAAKLTLSAAEGKAPATLVTRMAGNGEAFGISLAGASDVWITTPASAPKGPYLPNAEKDAEAIGAIGDSAVIDALGFGGQALQFAPEPRDALKPYLPARFAETAAQLLSEVHPAFGAAGVRVGLDAARAAQSGMQPIVTLGMVERSGSKGLLGRGMYQPPLELFTRATREAIGRNMK
jgi:hypothetical protein